MKMIIPFLLILGFYNTTSAQSDNQHALKALKGLMQTYTKNNGLSFDLRFTYAPESRPFQFLDSLKGSVKINGNRSWYLIDSTESVNTGDFLVTIFREDKLLFLAKPQSVSLPMNTGLNGMSEAWLYGIDSLAQLKKVMLEWKEDKETQQVTIRFPEAKQNKAMTFVIDRKSGLLRSSVTIARGDQLMDPESRREANITDEFAIITTYFQNYNKGKIEEALFEPSRYFIKKGDEYMGVNEFRDYKVFLGTPGM